MKVAVCTSVNLFIEFIGHDDDSQHLCSSEDCHVEWLSLFCQKVINIGGVRYLFSIDFCHDIAWIQASAAGMK